MVAQQLVAGLANVDHQRKILSEAATLNSFDAKIKRLQILETTEESAFALHGNPPPIPVPSEAAAMRSLYKKGSTSYKPFNQDSAAEETRTCFQKEMHLV